MTNVLRTLIPLEELEELEDKVPYHETPIWEYWGAYVDCRVQFERSSSTTRSVRDVLRKIIRNSHIYSIERLNNKDKLQAALSTLKEKRGFSNSTYNTYLKNVKTYLIWLEREGFIDNVEVRRVHKYPETIPPQKAQSEIEVQRILAQICTRTRTPLLRHRDLFFYQVLVLTGARPSELERLTVNSVRKSGTDWIIEVIGTKNKPSRRVYFLPPSVKDAHTNYMRYRKDIGRNEEYLFISRRRNKAWTQKGMRALMKGLQKELGFKVGMLLSRRFVATTLAKAGTPLDEISTYLAHRRRETTKRYIEQSGLLTSKNVDVINNLIFK
jgi:integrase